MKIQPTHSILLTLVACVGCASSMKGESNSVYQEDLVAENGEPAYITVQHCLISCRDAPSVGSSRSREEAESLANSLLEKAKAGEDFDRMVRRYTDDSPPGIYMMANHGFESSASIYAREGMVPAFGNVGFPLKVGEIGMAPFDQAESPFGWHIIKRIK